MPEGYDLVVVGGGAAGLGAARAAAAAEARTLLVSEGEIGGECTFTGCVPSKTLIEAAACGTAFPGAMTAVRQAVATIAATETAGVLAADGIEVVRGHAVFTAPGELSVAARVLRARRFVIATGSWPAIPPMPGLAETRYLTSETIWDLTERPARLAVLGGGAVGCELAQAFARLGSQVTIAEAARRLLPAAGPEASQVVDEVFRAEGIGVRTGVAIASVQHEDNGIALVLESGEKLGADRLLVATGRRPVTGHLGLEAAGVRLDDRGYIATDRHLATTAPGIYAAGDVTGRMPFTHAAFAMGRIAARNALRRRWSPPGAFDTSAIPWVVFTNPEVAQVGLTEVQAASHRAGPGGIPSDARGRPGGHRRARRRLRQDHRRPAAGPGKHWGRTGARGHRRGHPRRGDDPRARAGHAHRPARPDRPRLPHLVAGHPAGRRPVLRPVRRPHRSPGRNPMSLWQSPRRRPAARLARPRRPAGRKG